MYPEEVRQHHVHKRVYNELNCIACIPLDFIDGLSVAAAAQGEPKTRT